MRKKMRIGFLCLFFIQVAFLSAPAFASPPEFMDLFGASGWYLTKVQMDDEYDGTLDFTANYHYNSNDRLMSIDNDVESDGIIDAVIHLIYDSNGNIIRNDIDTGNDGTIDYSINYTYDSNGHLSRESVDYDRDGTIDYYSDFTYNGDKVIRIDEYYSSLHDTVTYTYDSKGNPTKEERDDYSDGSIDDVTTYIYNSNNKPIEERWDYDNDGVVDQISTYFYDSHGNLEREESDTDNDGVTDNVAYYTWVKGSGGSDDDDDDDANDKDNDGDGYTVDQGDCNDKNKNIHPGAIEICGDGIDNDCDGTVDENCGSLWAGDYTVQIQSKLTVKKVGKFEETNGGQLTLDEAGTFEMDDYSTPHDVTGTFVLDAKGKSMLYTPSAAGLAALEKSLIDWLEAYGLYNLDFTFQKIKTSKVKIDKKTGRAAGKIKLDVSGTVSGCMAGEGCGETKFTYKSTILLMD